MQQFAIKAEGHYQIALPWRSDNVKVTNNLIIAESRLADLGLRFIRDQKLFRKYSKKIKKYLSSGYARKIVVVLLFIFLTCRTTAEALNIE